MTATYNSKHGTVSRRREELFMAFTDLRNFAMMIPEDKRGAVEATFDTLVATVQGFRVGVKVSARDPYSKIELVDWDAPFAFHVTFHFDIADEPGKTDFSIVAEADLNFMMKTFLGSKIKDGLDKIVDGLVAVSEGKMPEGFDPSQFPGASGFPGGFPGSGGMYS